jgi:calcineurin-like phosphoesterase family protein
LTIFITSDTHFDHENIIRLCERPFASKEEMNETLIERWNERIKPRDEVWHLGDFAYKGEHQKFFDRLNGRKHLILGNHDDAHDVSNGWETVGEYRYLRHEGERFVLFHYPILEWDGFYKGAIHLHGHQHNRDSAWRDDRRIDVGVDASNFYPWAIEELSLLAKGTAK